MESTTETMDVEQPTDGAVTMRNGAGRFVKGHKRIFPATSPGKYKRRVTRWDARAILEDAEFDPIMAALEAYLTGFLPLRPGEDSKRRQPLSNESRMQALKFILDRSVSTLSGVQITGKDGGPIATAHLDVTQLMQDPELVAAAQALSLAATRQNAEALTDRERTTRALLPATDADIIDAETEDVSTPES